MRDYSIASCKSFANSWFFFRPSKKNCVSKHLLSQTIGESPSLHVFLTVHISTTKNVAVESFALLLLARNMSGSNLGLQTSYPDVFLEIL